MYLECLKVYIDTAFVQTMHWYIVSVKALFQAAIIYVQDMNASVQVKRHRIYKYDEKNSHLTTVA